VSSLINEIVKRQSKRLAFLENYVLKDQEEKIRTRTFKEQMDKEEIVHLKQEIGQLQEISEALNHPESQSHLISKRQSSIKNPSVTGRDHCSTSGNCFMLGTFCPYPDRIATTNNNSTIGIGQFINFYKLFLNKSILFLPFSLRVSKWQYTEGLLTASSKAVVFVAHKTFSRDVNFQVRFEEATLNIGGAFDLKESVFIAPKSGIYEFNFDGHKTGDHTPLNISLRVNKRDVVNTWSDYMGHHPGVGNHKFLNLISLHSILKLNKGDRIDVYNKNGTLHLGDNGNVVQPTQFTGKLLLEGIHWPTTSNNNSNQRSPILFNVQKSDGFCVAESPVPFEIVNINVGGTFNLTQQEFIIPVAGIYEFIVKGFKTEDRDEMEITIRHNQKRVANAIVDWVGNHQFHTSFSIYSILKAEKGDRIDLFLVDGCLYDDVNHYTTFTGKLLMEYASNSTPADAVYFNAQKQEAFTTANAMIPFEFAVLNIGGALNLNGNSNGHLFTAPRSGIYEFNVAGVKGQVQETLFIALRLNKQPVAHVWVDYASSHGLLTPFSLHSILKVKKGDTVDLFNVGGKGSETFDDGKRLTKFTGKLLYWDENMI